MWILLLILSAVVPSLNSEEYAPLQDLPKDEKKLLIELVKRLENDVDVGQLGWKDEAQCEVSTNKTSIIKKKDSLKNGAAFLTLYKNIESNEVCSNLCCKNASCDMAVFENKGDHYCYLFRCEGKCKFGHHSSYFSNNIGRHSHEPPADGSELDLVDLNSGSDTNSDDNDGSFKTASVVTTTTSTTTTVVYIRAHSVGLGGHCEQDIHCEDPSAVCSSLTCRCREGYYKKEHICRQVCPPSNFECLELGTLGRGPQCVPHVQVCDTIMQCADGSDEYNCPESGEPPIRTWQHELPLAEAPPYQQQSLPAQLQQQQQQSYPHGSFLEPQYNEQGMNAPDRNGFGQSRNPGSKQAFPQQGQSDPQHYAAYNSQPIEPQGSQLFQNSGQPPLGSKQPNHQAPPPSSITGYDADGNFINKGSVDSTSQGSGSPPQQPAGTQKAYQNPTLPKMQPPAGPQHSLQNPLSQPGDLQQQYPQGYHQTFQNSNFKQPDRNPGSEHSYASHEPQPSHMDVQQSRKDPDSQQSHQNLGSQAYPSSGQQQYPPPRGQVAKQASISDSRRPPQSGSGAQSLPGQAQLGKSRIYMEGGSPAKDLQMELPGQQDVPEHEQSSIQKSLPQSHPAPQVATNVVNPAQPKPPAKSGSVASSRPQGLHPADTSPELIDSQKAYIVPGHSKGQSSPDMVYHSAQGKGVPELAHPHSAYDVRIGEPGIPSHKTSSEQKSFLNPTELSDLDAQGPPRFLDGFGDQYLPQQAFGQQYNPYGRYPSAYPQNSGNQGSGYPAVSDQLYPGTQSQRVYPQQGYLDFGYPSPQYEFGEFDPPYAEADSYPGGHDVPAYRPDGKLGYGGLHKGSGTKPKVDKPTQQGVSHPSDAQEVAATKGDKQAAQPKGGNAGGKHPDLDQAPSSADSDNTDASSNTEEGSQEAGEKENPANSNSAGSTDSSPEEGGKKIDNSETVEEKGSEEAGDPGNQSQNTFISREKMDLTVEPASMQGPIIALSLGLAFTVILLIFVACRLRNVRRRLRKGRPLHSNEADYLINGMYL